MLPELKPMKYYTPEQRAEYNRKKALNINPPILIPTVKILIPDTAIPEADAKILSIPDQPKESERGRVSPKSLRGRLNHRKGYLPEKSRVSKLTDKINSTNKINNKQGVDTDNSTKQSGVPLNQTDPINTTGESETVGIQGNANATVDTKGIIDIEKLKVMSKEELMVIANERMLEVVEKIKKDAKFFIFNFCWTLDQQDSVHPIKRFLQKPYIEYVIDVWQNERLILIPKSRQMLMTWLMVGLHLWYAMYFQGRNVFYVSKKEDDADGLVERSKFIYEHLPEFLKVPVTKKYCVMLFSGINSMIRGVSQDSDALRMQTASAIFSDEMSFQPYARKSYQSARPTIEIGGKFTGVSSANGKGFFYNICNDFE